MRKFFHSQGEKHSHSRSYGEASQRRLWENSPQIIDELIVLSYLRMIPATLVRSGIPLLKTEKSDNFFV
mgnify:CR=1 FL=1